MHCTYQLSKTKTNTHYVFVAILICLCAEWIEISLGWWFRYQNVNVLFLPCSSIFNHYSNFNLPGIFQSISVCFCSAYSANKTRFGIKCSGEIYPLHIQLLEPRSFSLERLVLSVLIDAITVVVIAEGCGCFFTELATFPGKSRCHIRFSLRAEGERGHRLVIDTR